MIVINCVGESKRLSKAVLDSSHLSYNNIQKLLRNKDIKVNGKRINKDLLVCDGDKIEIYFDEKNITLKVDYQIVYEDDNILVVDKPAGVEVVSEKNDGLLDAIKRDKQLNELFAVHRIDRNTMGIVVFAKTMAAKAEFERAFKNHDVEKVYMTLVCGRPPKQEDTIVCYHFVDKVKALALISDTKKVGYTKIVTSYKLEKMFDKCSLLSVKIETGKTHQIRAVLSHIGCPIVGDGKYGRSETNKVFKAKTQKLVASKITLKAVGDPHFSYLLNKCFCSNFSVEPQ